MNEWVAYSLKCRKGQAGFALPVAIGMGLIILLVGLTMLLRSQDSQVSAIAQKDTAKSLNAAETGVNEIRALMNQHRAIANFPACESPRNADGTCPDSGSTESWALPGNISDIFATCNVDETAEIASVAQQSWRPVNPDVSDQGEYRLLSHAYDSANSTSTLTIQGRVNASEPSESVSEVSITFPLLSTPVANLWVSSTANTSQIDSQATVLGPCTSSSPIQQSALQLPQLPETPSVVNVLESSTNINLPGESDSSDPTTEFFHYRISGNLDSSFASSITVQDKQKIALWVEGNIDLRGMNISYPCNECIPFNAQIIGLDNSENTVFIDSNTTAICNVFIHAPTYNVESTTTVTVGSSPNVCTDGKKNSSVFWVRQWGDSGNSPILNTLIQPFTWAVVPPDLLEYPPSLGPIRSWTTQENSN